MELRELKLKNRKTCDCGHEFSNADIQPPIIINKDHKFYGGRVEYYVKSKCPKCGEEVYLLLEAYDNKYRVIDIGTEKAAKRGITKEEYDEAIDKEMSENKNEEEIKEVQFKCEKCGREFKSKSGLASHSRKCQ